MIAFEFSFSDIANNITKALDVGAYQSGTIRRIYLEFTSGTATGPITIEIADKSDFARARRLFVISSLSKGDTTQPHDEIVDIPYDASVGGGNGDLYMKVTDVSAGADNVVKVRLYRGD